MTFYKQTNIKMKWKMCAVIILDICTQTQLLALFLFLFLTVSRASYLPITLLQVVQALRVGLLANVRLVDNEIFASSLLS